MSATHAVSRSARHAIMFEGQWAWRTDQQSAPLSLSRVTPFQKSRKQVCCVTRLAIETIVIRANKHGRTASCWVPQPGSQLTAQVRNRGCHLTKELEIGGCHPIELSDYLPYINNSNLTEKHGILIIMLKSSHYNIAIFKKVRVLTRVFRWLSHNKQFQL
jgi:hypothetical protein